MFFPTGLNELLLNRIVLFGRLVLSCNACLPACLLTIINQNETKQNNCVKCFIIRLSSSSSHLSSSTIYPQVFGSVR